MRNTILVVCFIFLFQPFVDVQAQDAEPHLIEEKRGSFFFYWGYNRSFYSKTNLHFNGPNYDFTVYDLEATDRPTKFGATYFKPSSLTVPQYNVRLGYFITDRFAISAGMDHMKYVVKQNQMTRISGVITENASEKYAGSYLNEPIQLTEDLLKFEHTDGFNLASLDFEYLLPIGYLFNKRLAFQWNFGVGGIWIITKTDVRVMGDGLDNDFHIAGYTMTAKSGPRMEFKNRLFLAAEFKGGYASLPSVLIKNEAPEIGDHNLTFLEYYVVVGINFGTKKRIR